jgi:hypothetical protein
VRQEIGRATPLRIQASVIGDQSDVLSTEWREFLNFKEIEAGLHARGAARMFRGSAGRN